MLRPTQVSCFFEGFVSVFGKFYFLGGRDILIPGQFFALFVEIGDFFVRFALLAFCVRFCAFFKIA